MSNLQIRFITAVIFGSLALWLTWLGGMAFAIFCCVIGTAVFFEWNGVTRTRQTMASQILGWLFFALFCVALVAVFCSNFIDEPSALLVFSVVGIGAVVIAAVSGRNAGWTAGGFIYATVPVAALALLRGKDPFGFGAIIFLYAVVWGTDIAAYFNGRALGGPKLAPRFSPNKTWSGAIGGAAVAVAGGCLVVYLLFNTKPGNIYIPLLALVLSIASQVGDIGESWVKRHFSVKDSGTLLPGHGGFMDRVDGLVCAAVVLYLIGALVASADIPSSLFNLI